jgi:Ca2+-binding EF-hand superfamily protein
MPVHEPIPPQIRLIPTLMPSPTFIRFAAPPIALTLALAAASSLPAQDTPPPAAATPAPPAAAGQAKTRPAQPGKAATLTPAERTAAREQARKKLLERFDKDGDGALNINERKAAEAEREAKLLERFDADGDGKLSDSERAAARGPAKKQAPARPGAGNPAAPKRPAAEAARQKLLEKFDTDSDGKLSDSERAAARTARQNRKKSAPKS